MNFWDDTHPLAKDNTRLYDELVPAAGNCDTLQGELLRAAGKIGYDWYNNGWGCNNWSGAVVFLQENASTLASKRTEAERADFRSALGVAHSFSHGESVFLTDENADKVVTTIVAFVVQNILDNPTPIANSVDMYSLQEPDARHEDEDEEDDYWDEEDDQD